jgi:penicillin-binding protein 1C
LKGPPLKKTTPKRPLSRRILSLLLKGSLALVILFSLFYIVLGFFPDPLAGGPGTDWSLKVLDRDGRLLRERLAPRAGRRDFTPLEGFSPYLARAVITAEDKRFRLHPGVDPLALLRAAVLNFRRGEIVSGGSTITMQLARMTMGLSPGPRTYGRKLKECWLALLIERHRTKDEILESYLNLVPTGRLNTGFAAASRRYLGKDPLRLSPAEAALLAALPASPGSLDPYLRTERLLSRRDFVLEKMARGGFLDPSELARALNESPALNHAPPPHLAPHFLSRLEELAEGNPPVGPGTALRTSLDLDLQTTVEKLARETVAEHRGRGLEQTAVLVMSLPDREILAWVGSGDFHNPRDGQVDGVLAPRQPGSALKPFVYALAFDTGRLGASSMLEDAPADFAGAGGVFSPRNYSGGFSEKASARTALASSLNVPAVNLVRLLGSREVLAYFRELGLDTLTADHGHYGLGLALGDGEVSLLSLSLAYAALADGGILAPPRLIIDPEAPSPPPRRVMSPEAAFLVTDILNDDRARILGFGSGGVLDTPYPSAVKTGTSSNFRDNWCLGYTDKYLVAVWAGNFASRPMSRVSGVSGAGKLWRSVMDILAERGTPLSPRVPRGILLTAVCPVSGLPAGKNCPNRALEYFLRKFPLPEPCDHLRMEAYPVLGKAEGFRLLSPLSGEIYAYDPGLPSEQQRLKALAQSGPGVVEVVWILNGEEISRTAAKEGARPSILLPLAKGANRLEILGVREDGEPLRDRASYLVK